MTDLVPVKRALISLSDKTGLERLTEALTRARRRAGLDRRHRREASRKWRRNRATLATLPASRR